MKQTAVEQLVDKMKQTDDKVDLFAYSLGLKDGAKWQQEMEKQQIIDAFEQGEYTGRGFEDLTSEEYYNINFKSE
jgi:hypothetical protein